MTNNWKEIIIALIALIGIILGASFIIKIKIKKNTNKIVQKNNRVGGDQAGGNIRKS